MIGFIQPQHYVMRLLMLVAGCSLITLGICFQLQAKVIYNLVKGIIASVVKVTAKKLEGEYDNEKSFIYYG